MRELWQSPFTTAQTALPRFKRKPVAWGLLAFLAAVALLFLLWQRPLSYRLIAVNTADGREVMRVPVKPGDYFTIEFIHSYEKSPIWDFYKILPDGQICYAGTAFTFFSYDSRNTTFPKGYSLAAGTGKIVDIDKNYHVVFPELEMRVGITVPQWLVIKGDIYQFQALGKPGEKIQFRVIRGRRSEAKR